MSNEKVNESQHVCPWWIGWFLASPIRKLYHNPTNILKGYVSEGMKVADIGAALGYFSIPMARMVGKTGNIVCFDVQDSMINTLNKRLHKHGVSNVTTTHKSTFDSIGLNHFGNDFDFALAFAMVHEVENQELFFKEVYDGLITGGKLFIAEPKGHVTTNSFQESINRAKLVGFKQGDMPTINGSLSAVLIK